MSSINCLYNQAIRAPSVPTLSFQELSLAVTPRTFVLKRTVNFEILTLALAMGNMAAAQFSTTRFTDTTTSGIETRTPNIGTETTSAGGIGTPDGFNFLGCFSSENGFPGFTQAYSEDNDADLCAESFLCANFFGLYDNKCYCSSKLELATSLSVGADQCDIACPDDADVSCGGLAAGSRVIRRQVDLNVLLSIYIAVGVNPGETDTVVNIDFVTET